MSDDVESSLFRHGVAEEEEAFVWLSDLSGHLGLCEDRLWLMMLSVSHDYDNSQSELSRLPDSKATSLEV